MRQIVSAPFFIAGGALAGVASAYVAAQMLGTTAAAVDSNWKSRDISAASAVHPYTIAHFLLAGRLPPSVGQFVELSADRDAEGQPVTAACIYTLSLKAGKAPHWWSLSAYAGGGRLLLWPLRCHCSGAGS